MTNKSARYMTFKAWARTYAMIISGVILAFLALIPGLAGQGLLTVIVGLVSASVILKTAEQALVFSVVVTVISSVLASVVSYVDKSIYVASFLIVSTTTFFILLLVTVTVVEFKMRRFRLK